MPPQWNAYDEIPDPPLVAARSPLDDILAQEEALPQPPVQPQGIPSDLLTLGDVPEPPTAPGALPSDNDGIPEPPRTAAAPASVADLYEVPEPPMPAPEELAPDFAATDYERSKDRLEEPLSVDVAGAAQAAQAAERNYATLGTALAQVQDEVIGLSRKRGELTTQAQMLDQRISELKGTKKRTPEQEAELKAATEQRKGLSDSLKATESEIATGMERFGTAQQQVAAARESYEAARAKADMDMAAGQREAELRGAAAQQAGTEYFIAESKKLDQEYRAKTDKITTEANAARARMDEDRKAYRDVLKAGPGQQSVVLTVAAVIGEALAARRTGREPDFGRVIGGLEAATKAQFDDRVKRQLDLVAEGEDSLAKAAQERRIIEAEKAARKAEILSGIEIDIQSKMGAARGTLQEAQLATVYSDVRRERERQEAIAMEARTKQAQADEKARLDMELQKAKIREATAQAGIAEHKASGGGSGKPKVEAWSVREPTAVYVPYLDTKLADFTGQPNAEKRAEKAGALVTDSFKYLQSLQEYEALLEDYGSRKLMDKSGWTESAEFRELSTQHAQVKNALAKVIAGQGFSTTESDNRAAESMVPLPSAWNDQSRVAVNRMRKNGENQMRLTLNQLLDTAAQERLIKEARRFGTSRKDMQQSLVSRAPDVLTDAGKPVDARVAAVAALSENVRKGIKSDGEQAERDAILAELQEIKRATTAILETEYDPEDPVGGVTDDAAEVVQALRKREAELRAIWRRVGSDNATKREKERLENPKTPATLIESTGGIPSIR
jgi:hypothetical protein